MTWKDRLVRFSSFWMFPLLSLILVKATGAAVDLYWLLPIGLLLWTLLEYGLHRFVFHVEVRNTLLRRLVNASHLRHHAAPRDPDKILVHTSYGLVISALLLVLMYLGLGSWSHAAGIMTGIWAGFLYYELVHYRVHTGAAASWLIGRQRRRHFQHHFVDQTNCFGVTTPLWDYIFRTATSSEQP